MNALSVPFAGMLRRPLVALGLSVVVLLLTYRNTAASIVTEWSNNPLGHGYLVIPVAIHLLWRERHRLRAAAISPAYRFLPLLAAAACLWCLGAVAHMMLLQQVALLLMVICLSWGTLGPAGGRIVLYPLGVLVLALPVGEELIPVLQAITAQLAVKMLSLSGVPVFLQHHVISIPGGTWAVADACSGINYLTASITLGYWYAGVHYRYRSHRLWFLAAAALVPLAANAIRVYVTILLAWKGATRVVAGFEHYLFGWLVFGIVMWVLVATFGNWKERATTMSDSRSAAPARVGNGALKFAALALILVATAPLAVTLHSSQPDGLAECARLPAPRTSLPWQLADAEAKWTCESHSDRADFVASYSAGGPRVTLQLAYSRSRVPAVSVSTLIERAGQTAWISEATRTTFTLAGKELEMRETLLESLQGPTLGWSGHVVGGSTTGTRRYATWLAAKAKLLGQEGDALSIALAMPDRSGAVEARTVAQDFLDHLSVPDIDRFLSEGTHQRSRQ